MPTGGNLVSITGPGVVAARKDYWAGFDNCDLPFGAGSLRVQNLGSRATNSEDK